MGDFGSVIGALLQGSAQGFLEAKEEDKIKKQQAKDKATLQKRETVQRLLEMPGLRNSVKTIGLAFLAGGSGASKAEKDLNEILLTGQVPGTEEEQVTSGASPLGPATVNQEGKLDANSPNNVAIGAADREAPLPLGMGLPPAESFEPLEDFSTLSPRETMFRSQEEDDERALLLREKELRVAQRIQREEDNFEFQQTLESHMNAAEAVVGSTGLDRQGPAAKMVFSMAEVAAETGNDVNFQKAIAMANFSSMAIGELISVMDGLPVQNMTPDQVVSLVRTNAPIAFAMMKDAEGFVLRTAESLNVLKGDEQLEREYTRILRIYTLEEKRNAKLLAQAALATGGASKLDLMKFASSLDKRGDAMLKTLGNFAEAREDLTDDFGEKSDDLKNYYTSLIVGMEESLFDLERQKAIIRKQINEGPDEDLDDTTGQNPTEAQLVKRALAGEEDLFDQVPMSNPAKRKFVVEDLSHLNEGEIDNNLREMASIGEKRDGSFTSENDQISFDDIAQMRADALEIKEHRESKARLGFFR